MYYIANIFGSVDFIEVCHHHPEINECLCFVHDDVDRPHVHLIFDLGAHNVTCDEIANWLRADSRMIQKIDADLTDVVYYVSHGSGYSFESVKTS